MGSSLWRHHFKSCLQAGKMSFLPLFNIYTCRVNDFRHMSYQAGLAVMNRSRTSQGSSDTNKITSDSVIPLLEQNSPVKTFISELCRVKVASSEPQLLMVRPFHHDSSCHHRGWVTSLSECRKKGFWSHPQHHQGRFIFLRWPHME